MIRDKRTYTVSEELLRKQVRDGMWIGSVFGDHGRTMEVVKIGPRYKPSNATWWVIDVEAVETEKLLRVTDFIDGLTR